LLLRKSIRSHPGICKPQHTILWGLPKPGNANWALAAAGCPPLHSSTPPVFTASLLHSKSRITQHRAPSHTGTLDRSNTCLRSHTSRMGRPPPPFRTTSPCPPAFDTFKRAQRTRCHIQSRNDLDCKLSMWLNPFARPDASPAVPAYVAPANLTCPIANSLHNSPTRLPPILYKSCQNNNVQQFLIKFSHIIQEETK
jgi:hypothetical protein